MFALLLLASSVAATPASQMCVCGCTSQCNIRNVSDLVCAPYALTYNETLSLDPATFDWGGKIINSTVSPVFMSSPSSVVCTSSFLDVCFLNQTKYSSTALTQLDAKNCSITWTNPPTPSGPFSLVLRLRALYSTLGTRTLALHKQKPTRVVDFFHTDATRNYTLQLGASTCAISDWEWPSTITVTNASCGGSYVVTQSPSIPAQYAWGTSTNCSADAVFSITASPTSAPLALPPNTGPPRIYIPPAYDLGLVLGATVGGDRVRGVRAIRGLQGSRRRQSEGRRSTVAPRWRGAG